MIRNLVLSLLSFLCLPLFAVGQRIDLNSNNIYFQYRQENEPYNDYSCTQLPDPYSPYDWKVECQVDQILHKYNVHLALDFYPRTTKANSGYEFLYWVTDETKGTSLDYQSTTMWIHNDAKDDQMRVVEASQGIEQSNAALKLSLYLKGRNKK